MDAREGAGNAPQGDPVEVQADPPVDMPAEVPGPAHSPLMKDHGKRWCNIDAQNVIEGGRRRKVSDVVNRIVRGGGPISDLGGSFRPCTWV